MADEPTKTPPVAAAATTATAAAPAAGEAGLGAKIDELARKIAGTADADTKAFLAALMKPMEGLVAEVSAVKAKLEAAEAKAADATAAMAENTKKAALKLAATAAGAVDPAEVLAFVKTSDVKLNEAGEPENVSALVEALKTVKPHLFGKAAAATATAASSSTATPPAATAVTPKDAREMTPEQLAAEYKKMGIDPTRFRRR